MSIWSGGKKQNVAALAKRPSWYEYRVGLTVIDEACAQFVRHRVREDHPLGHLQGEWHQPVDHLPVNGPA
jgi:hypothetical protein